jgi:hypothetical protein
MRITRFIPITDHSALPYFLDFNESAATKSPVTTYFMGVTRGGSVFQFFSITYLITWSCWIAAIVKPAQPQSLGLQTVLLLVGTIAPGVLALTLSAYSI